VAVTTLRNATRGAKEYKICAIVIVGKQNDLMQAEEIRQKGIKVSFEYYSRIGSVEMNMQSRKS
jgi:glycerate kinase